MYMYCIQLYMCTIIMAHTCTHVQYCFIKGMSTNSTYEYKSYIKAFLVQFTCQ